MTQQSAQKGYFSGKVYGDVARVMRFAWQAPFGLVGKLAKGLRGLVKQNPAAALIAFVFSPYILAFFVLAIAVALIAALAMTVGGIAFFLFALIATPISLLFRKTGLSRRARHKSAKGKQPAGKSYFFGKAYSDAVSVMRFAWQAPFGLVAKLAKRLFAFLKRNTAACLIAVFVYGYIFLFFAFAAILALAAALVMTVGGIAFFLFVIVGTGVSFLLCAVFAFSDFIFCILRGIKSHCPVCQERFIYPAYSCPKCGVVHSRLRPGVYGIFKRKCTCGQKLPTTFFNGRQKLTAVCTNPMCTAELKDGGRHVEISIPVIGGANSGKTVFITSAIMELENTALTNGLDFTYSPLPGDDFETNKRMLLHGSLPQKTSDMQMRYYQFYLSNKGAKIKNLVSLCDVAGETFADREELFKQAGYKNADAFMVIVDPLSMGEYRGEIKGKIDFAKYRFSAQAMDEILGTLLILLENTKGYSAEKKMDADVAVVFTKCDVPGLDDMIGKNAVNNYMRGGKVGSEYDAVNALCEDFLVTYHEENFLNTLKSKFKSVQFFTCSALGHVADGRKFTPTGVDEPLLWLVDKVSKSINLEGKWGKKI